MAQALRVTDPITTQPDMFFTPDSQAFSTSRLAEYADQLVAQLLSQEQTQSEQAKLIARQSAAASNSNVNLSQSLDAPNFAEMARENIGGATYKSQRNALDQSWAELARLQRQRQEPGANFLTRLGLELQIWQQRKQARAALQDFVTQRDKLPRNEVAALANQLEQQHRLLQDQKRQITRQLAYTRQSLEAAVAVRRNLYAMEQRGQELAPNSDLSLQSLLSETTQLLRGAILLPAAELTAICSKQMQRLSNDPDQPLLHQVQKILADATAKPTMAQQPKVQTLGLSQGPQPSNT